LEPEIWKKIPEEIRKAHGLEEKLVRFSIGIEDIDDIIDDLESAIKKL
jgi:cystathionine beta-lyase/cystathionine gamma-synthase